MQTEAQAQTQELARFTYNGVPIHDAEDGFLNLTDMWRASGSDPKKGPAEWRRWEGSRQFIEYICDQHGISHDECIRVVRGGLNPRTEAHWQIAFAYAKYLSPAFNAWCNEVVRAYYEGNPAPSTKPLSSIEQLELVIAAHKELEAKMLAEDERLRIETKEYIDQRISDTTRALMYPPQSYPEDTQRAILYPDVARIGGESATIKRAICRYAKAATADIVKGLKSQCAQQGISATAIDRWVRQLINHGANSDTYGKFAGFRDVVGLSLNLDITKGALQTLPIRALQPILDEIPNRTEEAVGYVRANIESNRGAPAHLIRRYPVTAAKYLKICR